MAMKDGTPYYPPLSGPPDGIIQNHQYDMDIMNTIKAQFTAAQIDMVKGAMPLAITLYVNSDTGAVDEVSFYFIGTEPWAKIPLETYRAIELIAKKKFTFQITAQGRRYNYYRYGTGIIFPKPQSRPLKHWFGGL